MTHEPKIILNNIVISYLLKIPTDTYKYTLYVLQCAPQIHASMEKINSLFKFEINTYGLLILSDI